jgi:hypothetical protein
VSTPFDVAVAAIAAAGYHNHRLEQHSDVVSDGIVADLQAACEPFRLDVESGAVRIWKNVSSPGDRGRRVDLFVGEPDASGNPDMARVRIAIENKSVITAHRNRTNRFDDLSKVMVAIQATRPQAILIATVLVGLAERVLNVPDKVHSFYRDHEEEFERDVLPRLSTGDVSLWEEFSWAISHNSAKDPAGTVELFRTLPVRGPAETHLKAYDSVLIVPVRIDNVNPPELPRPNELGIDVDAGYEEFILKTCRAYTARYHL